MNASLCPQQPDSIFQAENFAILFDKKQTKDVQEMTKRELPPRCNPKESCTTNLFFGFFFDGTKNNYVLAEKAKTLSNVARLYDCYPGQSVPGVLPKETDWPDKENQYTHFFKVYIPGVASPFKEVNDSGAGLDLRRGAVGGYKGEARIVWAFLQAINNVHRYFHKEPLIDPVEAAKLISRITLNKSQLAGMVSNTYDDTNPEQTRFEFKKILTKLHGAVKRHWPDPTTKKPFKIDPGIVQTIFISSFGFSRGAVQARAFTNWLVALCQLDAQLCGASKQMTLGGFNVQFDFLGLFDSVASIGIGNTLSNGPGKYFDGHGDWADAEISLRVPDHIKCVHLVAAHELRRSFPLDSIAVGKELSAQSKEIVFPGVHSDLGCGYAPREQGRGVDPEGADMLARIPLLTMYKEARLAGVPLKLELASTVVKQRFKLAPATLKAFNRYIAACPATEQTLTAIMRAQATLQMQWRLLRRAGSKNPLEASDSFQHASTFEKNDLHSANLEFDEEIATYNEWLKDKGATFKSRVQRAGFNNTHASEWEEIAAWWNKPPLPDSAILDFFDNYVHDSRAWFKVDIANTYPDNEPEMIANLKTWERTRMLNAMKYVRSNDGLTDAQRNAGKDYARTGQIPQMITTGREPFEALVLEAMAGYLRFRKIYGGRDAILLSDRSPENEAVAQRA